MQAWTKASRKFILLLRKSRSQKVARRERPITKGLSEEKEKRKYLGIKKKKIKASPHQKGKVMMI
jgi:hypothetical protein